MCYAHTVILHRFGHSAIVVQNGLMLAMVGGYGAGAPLINWRKRKSLEGARNDVIIIDLGVPNVTSIEPQTAPATGLHADVEAVLQDGELVLLNSTAPPSYDQAITITIHGRNFGQPCLDYGTLRGTRRCNTTCTRSHHPLLINI